MPSQCGKWHMNNMEPSASTKALHFLSAQVRLVPPVREDVNGLGQRIESNAFARPYSRGGYNERLKMVLNASCEAAAR